MANFCANLEQKRQAISKSQKKKHRLFRDYMKKFHIIIVKEIQNKHNSLFHCQAATTRKKAYWYFAKPLDVSYIRSLKMFTLFDTVGLGNYFKSILQN